MLTLARLFGGIAAAGPPPRAPARAAQKRLSQTPLLRRCSNRMSCRVREWPNILWRAAGLTLAAAMQLSSAERKITV
jgi:hypothetical protein